LTNSEAAERLAFRPVACRANILAGYAEEALRLNERLTFPSRKLTDPQRKQLEEWIQKPPAI